ncbi:MAG: hemerythrin domain-containing protein [Elusimicrobia bacterium]|nr:hemerythrin domain-containing protein [Candidatus Obscuribacterium magneticum]
MKITDHLLEDHKILLKMIGDLGVLTEPPSEKSKIDRLREGLGAVRDRLTLHSWYEDIFYYPLVRNAIKKDSKVRIDHAFMDTLNNDHTEINEVLDWLEAELKGNSLTAEWRDTFLKFSRALESHILKEEAEAFPASMTLLGEDRLTELFSEAQSHLHEAPPLRPWPV